MNIFSILAAENKVKSRMLYMKVKEGMGMSTKMKLIIDKVPSQQ